MWSTLSTLVWQQNDGQISRSAFLFVLSTGLTLVITITYFGVWCWLVFLATVMGTPIDLPASTSQMGVLLMGGSGMGTGITGINYGFKRAQETKLRINKVLDPGTE